MTLESKKAYEPYCPTFTMNLSQNFIISLLILLVAAPLDTAATAWMVTGMGAVTHVNAQVVDLDDLGDINEKDSSMAQSSHHHEGGYALNTSKTATDSHHDDAEICDDHCMNCSTHCFSSALVTASSDFLGTEKHFASTFTGDTSDRAYLLFRPPIHT